jgi:hypothetical protein
MMTLNLKRTSILRILNLNLSKGKSKTYLDTAFEALLNPQQYGI